MEKSLLTITTCK